MFWHTSDDSAPGAPRFSLARRMFIHWGPDSADRSAHLDVYFRHSHSHGWGGYLRFDGTYAETPIDAALFLGPAFAFAGTSTGRRLCRWLRVQDGHSRQIGLELRRPEGGWRNLAHWTLTWSAWTDPDHQVRPTKYVINKEGLSRWYVARRGYVNPIGAVLDRALGKVAYTLEPVEEPQEAVAYLSDGAYPLTLQLERATWQRPRSRRRDERTSVEIRVDSVTEGGPGFCPTGKYSYGDEDGIAGCFTRQLTAREASDPERWVPIAVAHFTEVILRDRARYGWLPRAARQNLRSSPSSPPDLTSSRP